MRTVKSRVRQKGDTTKADNFASVIMSYFHVNTLSKDRGVMPRLLMRKKTGFDGFIIRGLDLQLLLSSRMSGNI